MMRLIVAGTRHATGRHVDQIGQVLQPICTTGPGVLAHGGAPGVDLLAAQLAHSWGWKTKEVPASWGECDLTVPDDLGGCPDWPHRRTRADGSSWCPYAGRRRNQKLVDLVPRADLVVVFPADGPVARSRGTWDLHRRAIRAGLDTHTPVPLLIVETAGRR